MRMTDAEFEAARKMVEEHDAEFRRRFGNSCTGEEGATLPHAGAVSNALRSRVEVEAFLRRPPEGYFLYVNEKAGTATTWTGDVLGEVSLGRAWRSNMGDLRVPVTVHAINGRTYHGTYYKGAGNYARVRASKR